MKINEEIKADDIWIKKCWDGSIIVIYSREKINGEWIATGLECPPKPPSPI